MELRALHRRECELLRELDRSELSEEVYSVQAGRLVRRPERWDVKGFAEAELEALVARQRALHDGGGMLQGAFEGGRIAAMASVERRLRGAAEDRVKMDILYVSRPFRGRGLGRAMVAWAAEVARGFGARFLYVSATPTRHTVDFYLACGARLAGEPDPELLALEPEDVHLVLPIG